MILNKKYWMVAALFCVVTGVAAQAQQLEEASAASETMLSAELMEEFRIDCIEIGQAEGLAEAELTPYVESCVALSIELEKNALSVESDDSEFNEEDGVDAASDLSQGQDESIEVLEFQTAETASTESFD